MKKKSPFNPNADQVKIIHLDQDVVVVDKPSGMTTIRHPNELRQYRGKAKFLPKTLAEILPSILSKKIPGKKRKGTPLPLKAIHRLDKDTSGLLVFARNSKTASFLGKQFRDHSIQRKYLSIVSGSLKACRLESKLVRDRGDGLRGSHPSEGKLAVTHITPIKQIGDVYTLIQCILETGRTHQIRIHLSEAGYPICGETLYLRRFKKKKLQDNSHAPRLALHAAFLRFTHPRTKKSLKFQTPLPQELKDLIKRLENPR